MMRAWLLIVALVLMVLGCQTTTQFIEPDRGTYTIKSGSDSLVTMKRADWEITVDNRGKPNIFESLLGWLLLKTPEVTQVK